MLSHPQAQPGHGRQQRSLRQEYEEFILQRIEEFKERLSREELLAIADEAVRELEVEAEDQLVLTEVLVLEHVDRLIMRRLNLPTFRRWRPRHLRLRKAQREPRHWGLDPDSPLALTATALPEDGVALVVGAGAAPAAFFLAAHDWPVLFIDRELSTVEAVETRAASEALAVRFQALVVDLGEWFPEVDPTLVVMDGTALSALAAQRREKFFSELKRHTAPGGVHYLMPVDKRRDAIPLGPSALKSHYGDWKTERMRLKNGTPWFAAAKPGHAP
ncbi:MAG: hypothetical protein ACE5PT_06200 [Gemmatimonadales bacterium]